MRRYIISSTIILSLSAIFGFSSLLAMPDLSETANEQIQKQFQPLIDVIVQADAWQMAVIIFINNAVKALLAILLGVIFGIYTVFLLSINGFLLGVLGASAVHEGAFSLFLAGILPHGVIEIPAIIVAGALGLQLAKESFRVIARRQHDFKKTFNTSIVLFWRVILPLLALAAVIEVFFTPYFMSFFA